MPVSTRRTPARDEPARSPAAVAHPSTESSRGPAAAPPGTFPGLPELARDSSDYLTYTSLGAILNTTIILIYTLSFVIYPPLCYQPLRPQSTRYTGNISRGKCLGDVTVT